MKQFGLLCVAVVLAVACGESTPPQRPVPAHVRWTLSAVTCAGGGPIILIVDGTIVGTEPLVSGDTSSAYEVAAGAHTLEAKTEVQPGREWQPYLVTLKAGQNFTRILDCCALCSVVAGLSPSGPESPVLMTPTTAKLRQDPRLRLLSGHS